VIPERQQESQRSRAGRRGMTDPTISDVEREAYEAEDAYQRSLRTYGQKALVWSVAAKVRVLVLHGAVLSLEEEPTDLFDWLAEVPPGDGLWIWEGWARLTNGGPEYPNDGDMEIGGEFRRLNADELVLLGSGSSVFSELQLFRVQEDDTASHYIAAYNEAGAIAVLVEVQGPSESEPLIVSVIDRAKAMRMIVGSDSGEMPKTLALLFDEQGKPGYIAGTEV
jgi:hypothetical protein